METSTTVAQHTRRPLGKSGVLLPPIGFGGAPIGGFRGAVPEEHASAAIRVALDAGITLFDTSPFYGYGRSELRIGRELRDLSRDSFVLSTKVGRVLGPLDAENPEPGRRQGGLPFGARFDYSAAGAERSLEQSIMRLGIPEIDVVLIHDVDVFTHGTRAEADRRYEEAVTGCYPYLANLRKEQKVRAIGVGLNEIENSLRFARDTDIDCILLAGWYTLLDQDAADALLPLCQKKGIGIILGAPFSSGVLATGVTEGARYNYGAVPNHVATRVERIQQICQRHHVDLRSAALQFPLGHAAITCVLPGAVSAAEVNGNVGHINQAIPDLFWEELVGEDLVRSDVPLPGHRQSMGQ